MKLSVLIIIYLLFNTDIYSQNNPYLQIARIQYSGGGDWYNDSSSEENLLKFVAENTNIKTKPEYFACDLETNEIFNFPITFLTGHGNIVFSEKNVKTLREYFELGGFMFVDDDYGLDKSFRREIKKIFPNNDLVELPFNHEIYHALYNFENGPPKIHEHDNKPPKGFGLFLGNRMVLYYTVESNAGDGWASPEVHNDPPNKREEALKFGTNIIVYALSN